MKATGFQDKVLSQMSLVELSVACQVVSNFFCISLIDQTNFDNSSSKCVLELTREYTKYIVHDKVGIPSTPGRNRLFIRYCWEYWLIIWREINLGLYLESHKIVYSRWFENLMKSKNVKSRNPKNAKYYHRYQEMMLTS